MKLWQKGEIAQDDKALITEKFTVGNDRLWDMRLAEFDVTGSMAHAEMLVSAGIISNEEGKAIAQGLSNILNVIKAGTFVIEDHVEDVHSQVE